MVVSGEGNEGTDRVSMLGEERSVSLKAELPHLLLGIFGLSPDAIGAIAKNNQNAYGYLPMMYFCSLLLGVLIYFINKYLNGR